MRLPSTASESERNGRSFHKSSGLNVPSGLSILANSQGYNLETNATTSGLIDVCIKVPTEYSQTRFARLKILHGEGANLVDRTTSLNYQTRTICAQVSSLSPFVIAETLAPTAASVTVSGKVLTANGSGIRNARVIITDSNGNSRQEITGSFGYYRFENINVGETYVVTVFSKRFSFSQSSQIISVNEDLSEVNFIAE